MRNVNLAGTLSGFVGGLFAAYVMTRFGPPGAGPSPAVASVSPRAAATATSAAVVSAERIQLTDAGGRVRAELAMSRDGAPGIFFYDTKGRNRLVLGLYSPAESEYPFVVLNDVQQRAVGIFRVFGTRETPVVVLKNQGQDRSIYGLNAGSTDPFLVNYSRDGRKLSLFGDF